MRPRHSAVQVLARRLWLSSEISIRILGTQFHLRSLPEGSCTRKRPRPRTEETNVARPPVVGRLVFGDNAFRTLTTTGANSLASRSRMFAGACCGCSPRCPGGARGPHRTRTRPPIRRRVVGVPIAIVVERRRAISRLGLDVADARTPLAIRASRDTRLANSHRGVTAGLGVAPSWKSPGWNLSR